MDVPERISSEDPKEHPEIARDAKTHSYSRLSQGVRSRVERVLSEINVRILMTLFDEDSRSEMQGGYAITYGSGLAAAYAVS
jgi:hypothetical protein